jgi:hypothetical protein
VNGNGQNDGGQKPIEIEGAGGKEIIGFETVQEPLRVEGVKAETKSE